MTPGDSNPLTPKVPTDPVIPIHATRFAEKLTPGASQSIRHTRLTEETFSGPMPPPEYLARYEEVCKGAANRMLTLVENESAHRHRCEVSIIEAQRPQDDQQFAEAKRGQICAFIIAIVAFSLATYLGMNGHEVTGGCVGVSGIGSIVATFIAGRRQEVKEARQGKEEDSQG